MKGLMYQLWSAFQTAVNLLVDSGNFNVTVLNGIPSLVSNVLES